MMKRLPGMSQEISLEIVGNIYETIFQPDRWPKVFEHVGSVTNSFSFLFGEVVYGGDVNVFSRINFDNDHYDILLKHYTNVDTNPVMRLFQQAPVGSIFTGSEHFPGDRWSRLDVGRDVFIPQDIHFFLSATIARGNSSFAPLSVMRSKQQGDFTAKDLEFCQFLVTHMVRALRAYNELGACREHQGELEDALNLLGCGIALINKTGQVSFLNYAARALVDRRDGLTLDRCRLMATQSKDRLKFAAMIAHAISSDSISRQGGALVLTRPNSITPLPCLIVPIGGRLHQSLFSSSPAALVLLGRSEEQGCVDHGPLARLYGLSAKQTELITLILEGQSLPKAAQAMEIAPSTAKTHLNRALSKIGAGNLSDLDRLILNGPLGFVAPQKLRRWSI
ncbi:MAG: helix-turn-helix transcriptional regulator [Geminicoccales bacterium]